MSPSPTDTCRLSLSITEGETDYLYCVSSRRFSLIQARCALYVAANSILTRSSRWSSLKAWGMKLKKNRGHKKAVIAVARKLAVILHRLWIEETQFQWGTEGVRS